MSVINPNQLYDTANEPREIPQSVADVFGSGELFRYRGDGATSFNERVESEFAQYLGSERTMTVANGTAGLRLALLALGVKPGDVVLVNAYSFIACAMAIVSVGAVPHAVDLNENLGIDVEHLRRELPRAAAVLAVHVQGHMVPVREIRSLCDEFGVPLIEDFCQGMGAWNRGVPAGATGDLAVTSFQQSKQISCGEGGLIAGKAEHITRAYKLADLGAVRAGNGMPDWDAEGACFAENLRLTEIQAALVLDQLRAIDDTIARQQANRNRLWTALEQSGVQPVHSQDPRGDSGSHTLLYAKSADASTAFCGRLAEQRVLARVVWRKPFTKYGLFQRSGLELAYAEENLLAARDAARIVSVATPKYVTGAEVDRIAAAVLGSKELLADGKKAGRA